MTRCDEQIQWLKTHASSFSAGRHTLQVLQKAGQDFLAGIGANIGGGSRRMPELCCIAVEVTAQNPIRGFRQVFIQAYRRQLKFIHDRVFENEGILVGDYRKNQGQMLNPQEDLSLWALPAPAARLLCRLVIYGKPLEVRLVSEWFSTEASIVHRTLIGAFEGKPLKSTKLGMLTNAVLSAHGCPGVQYMRHAREHFSMELMLDVSASSNRKETRALEVPIHDTYGYESIHKIVTHSTGTYARGSCIVQQSLIQDG
jgi:hypothetical protein